MPAVSELSDIVWRGFAFKKEAAEYLCLASMLHGLYVVCTLTLLGFYTPWLLCRLYTHSQEAACILICP